RRGNPNPDALIFRGEDRAQRRASHDALLASTSRFAQALVGMGVGVGDRVAAYVPNMPEAIIAMLATTSLGAIWSSCSPDFGVRGVLDRFGQIEPRVLVTVDGYWYNGKPQPVLDRVVQLLAQLPSVERVVIVPYLQQSGGVTRSIEVPRAVSWDGFLAPFTSQPMRFARLPFDHPVYILYSSGTTGVP